MAVTWRTGLFGCGVEVIYGVLVPIGNIPSQQRLARANKQCRGYEERKDCSVKPRCNGLAGEELTGRSLYIRGLVLNLRARGTGAIQMSTGSVTFRGEVAFCA